MSNRREQLILLNSALTRLMRHIRRVDEAQGVGYARLSALAVLHFGGACSLSELAEAEMVSKVTMHHVIKGLENDGLVRISTDPADRRRQIISLTSSGRATIERAHQARINYLDKLANPIKVNDLRQAVDTLLFLRDGAAMQANEASR